MFRSRACIAFIICLNIVGTPFFASAIDFLSYARGPLDVNDSCTKTPIISRTTPLIVQTVDYVVGITLGGDMVVDCSFTPKGLSTSVTWCFEKRAKDPVCTEYEADSLEAQGVLSAVVVAKKHPRQSIATVTSVQPVQVTVSPVVVTPAPAAPATINTFNTYNYGAPGYIGYQQPTYVSQASSDIQKLILGVALGVGIVSVGRSISNWGSGFGWGGGSSYYPVNSTQQRIWELGNSGSASGGSFVSGFGGGSSSGGNCYSAGGWSDVNGELKPTFSGSTAGCSGGLGSTFGGSGAGTGITAGSWQDVNGELKPVFPGSSGRASLSGSGAGLDPFDAQSRASVPGTAVSSWEDDLRAAGTSNDQGGTFSAPDIPGDRGGSNPSPPSSGPSPFNPQGIQVASFSGDSGSDTLTGGSGSDFLGGQNAGSFAPADAGWSDTGSTWSDTGSSWSSSFFDSGGWF